MPHNIGKMFYFGERPWHTLGTPLKQPADVEEALAAGWWRWCGRGRKAWMTHDAPIRTKS